MGRRAETRLNLMNIRAVTFDVGGTFIVPWPSVGHVYSEVAEQLGMGFFTPESLTVRFDSAWRAKTGFDYSRRAWRAVVDATFTGLVPESQTGRLFPALYERFEKPDVWRVLDDVVPTLRELRAAGFKLGVISNWDERLRPLLGQLDLTRWFDTITISIEAGATKPSLEIFQRAAEAFELPPEAILHVGDSSVEDFRGAQAAGFSALVVDRCATNSWGLQSLRVLPVALADARSGSLPD
jgi:putative hydrolase of the HAD superfamily